MPPRPRRPGDPIPEPFPHEPQRPRWSYRRCERCGHFRVEHAVNGLTCSARLVPLVDRERVEVCDCPGFLPRPGEDSLDGPPRHGGM